MADFPCKHSFGEIISFKLKDMVVEGEIVGVVVSGSRPETYYAEYKVNSLIGRYPIFHLKQVPEHKIIER